MNNQEIDRLLIRCIEGTASSDDYSYAWDWIQQNAENRVHYENLRDICLSVSVFQPFEPDKAREAWIRFKEKNDILNEAGLNPIVKGKSRILPRLLKIAATLILTFLLGGITFQKLQDKDRIKGLNTDTYLIEAPRGAKSLVNMPDGTKIWLNAGSKISYNRGFNQGNRDINLEGEAFFVVAKNQHLPFYVYSSGISIKAIGTSFNVKAYPDEDIVETTLVEGSISIESVSESGKTEKILLKPNQNAAFYKANDSISLEPELGIEENILAKKDTKITRIEVARKVDTEYFTSWKDKRWIFKEQELGEFAIVLERIYDVKIIFKDEELKSYSLSGSFDEVNLEQVLDAIQLTVPMNYSIERDNVVFTMDKNLKTNYDNLLKTQKRK